MRRLQSQLSREEQERQERQAAYENRTQAIREEWNAYFADQRARDYPQGKLRKVCVAPALNLFGHRHRWENRLVISCLPWGFGDELVLLLPENIRLFMRYGSLPGPCLFKGRAAFPLENPRYSPPGGRWPLPPYSPS